MGFAAVDEKDKKRSSIVCLLLSSFSFEDGYFAPKPRWVSTIASSLPFLHPNALQRTRSWIFSAWCPSDLRVRLIPCLISATRRRPWPDLLSVSRLHHLIALGPVLDSSAPVLDDDDFVVLHRPYHMEIEKKDPRCWRNPKDPFLRAPPTHPCTP